MKDLRPISLKQAEEDMISMARQCDNNDHIVWLTADGVHSAGGCIWVFSPEHQMSSPNHQLHIQAILESTDSIGLRGVGEAEDYLFTIIERMPSDLHTPLMYYKSIYNRDPRIKFKVVRSKVIWWLIKRLLSVSEFDERRGSRLELSRITTIA